VIRAATTLTEDDLAWIYIRALKEEHGYVSAENNAYSIGRYIAARSFTNNPKLRDALDIRDRKRRARITRYYGLIKHKHEMWKIDLNKKVRNRDYAAKCRVEDINRLESFNVEKLLQLSECKTNRRVYKRARWQAHVAMELYPQLFAERKPRKKRKLVKK
jgi:hypothetical protein